jgi:uncharacterized membrane protein YsdA (DUF1294 family)
MFAGVVCYLLAMNLWAFTAFWEDKRAARLGQRRTPERTLLMLALIGGTSGAIAAQQLLRHKTRKEPFRSILWAIAGAQALLLVGLYVRALAAR